MATKGLLITELQSEQGALMMLTLTLLAVVAPVELVLDPAELRLQA